MSANEVVRSRDAWGVPRFSEERPHLTRTLQDAGIARWQFWRVVRANRFLRPAERRLVQRYDDSGRPLLTALGYHLLGGISPFLIFWLGPLLALPLLAWSALELAAAGRAAAAAIFALLLGLMPFLADVATLTYSTAGFHVLSVVGAVPLVAYSVLHPRPTVAGLALRTLGAGVVLAACILARGGSLLTVGGAVLAVAAGAARAGGGGRRAVAAAAASLGLLAAPYLAARLTVRALSLRTAAAYGQTSVPPQRHAFWFGMWTGLGDFDRVYGHQWLDSAASEAGVRAGGVPLWSDGYDPSNEPVFRRLVTGAIRRDPGWFAAILVRRAAATVTQRKLWPWPPTSGRSLAEPSHRNEGAIDAYYSLATPADRFGLRHVVVEVPVPLLALPAALLVAAPWTRPGRRFRSDALALAFVSASVLPLPVLVTTAGAVEAQAFVIVYLLAAALLADVLIRSAIRRAGAPSGPATPAGGADLVHPVRHRAVGLE